jgi:hypothetical protein
MLRSFVREQTHRAMNRTNERCLCLIALALFYLSFSPPITSAHSHHDYNAVSHEQGADRSVYGKTHTIQRNDPPGDNISPTSPEAIIAVEENRSNISTSTRVHSNQHSLISVSVLVEIEEHTIMPITLSPDKNDNRYKKDIDGRAQVLYTFDEHNSSIASPRNNIDIVWTVSVEEIQVGGSDVNKDDSKLDPKPYSQLVLLEWKKIKEVNEYVIESSHDTDIKSGFTNANIVAPKRLYRNLIHFSGTANCTFMIPLERDDSSFHSSSAPSSSSSSLTKTFIVSLMQSTRLAASMTSDSLYDDIRSNNNSNERNTTTVLTRRLATLPRKTDSHYQSIIDPVVKVILHHSQRQRYHEEPQLPGNILSEDYDFNSRDEKGPTNDDNVDDDNKSGYVSKNNLRDLFGGESNFLWTLLLLSTLHAMRSIPIGYILKLVFCLNYLQSLGCAMFPVHTQEYNGEDYKDNTHHHDDGKEEEDVDNEGCHYLEDDHRCNQRFEEAEEKENQVRTIPHLQLAPSYSDKNANMIETGTCFSKDPRQKDHPKNFESHDSYNITFCCGDYDDNNNNLEKEGKKGEPNDNNLDHILDNPLIVHEEAPLEDDIVRLRPNMELTAINSDISTFNDNLLEASNPKFENVNTSFGSSHKIAVLTTVSHPKNYANSLKSAVAATMGSSSRNNLMSQISHNLMNNSEEMKCINMNDISERSIKTTEPKTYSDPPFKDSPLESSYIVNCTNEKEDSDYSSPKELPREDHRFGSLGSKTQLDDARRSLSEETPKSRCDEITDHIYKNPTKDLFEVMYENSDAKVKIVPPLGLSSEKLLMADKRVKGVNSIRGLNNSYIGPLHEDDILVDNLPTKECPAMNSLTAGTGIMRRSSITHTKDIILGVDQETQGGDFLDQTTETHDLKKRHNESSLQVEKPSQFLKKGDDSIERGTGNHTIMGDDLDMALKHIIRKDQNQDTIVLSVGGHDNDVNYFSKKTNEVKGYRIHSCEYWMEGPSRRRKEATAMGALSSEFDSPSSLPPRGHEILTQFSNLEQHKMHQARLGQSDQDLAKKSEIKINDSFLGSPTANTTDRPPKSTGLRVDNLKQIESLSEHKKSKLQKKQEIRNGNLRWKRNISQGSETEESYVSTLPPDSDYVSDDDPSLLFLGCSTSESQAFASQSISNSSENERKQREILKDARFGKRRKLSRYNGLPDEAALTRDATLTVINPEMLQKESTKETDLDSVEVVRVIIPDKLKKRGKRPYSKSNYVADWVPSNELQSMSQAFLHEESWDIVTPNLQTSNTRVFKSISLQSKKSKDGFSSSSIPFKQSSHKSI